MYEWDGVGEIDGTYGTMSTNGMNGAASVPRIVDTDGPAKRREEVVEGKPQSEKVGSSTGHIEEVCAPTTFIYLQNLTSTGTQ